MGSPALAPEEPHQHPHPAENEHRSMGHGGLRAAVFGASDGLVSNAALVLGVASGSSDPGVVALAGVAGLLAGAFSMAAGEWISVKAQREALERELRTEQEHLRRYPAAEQAHIREILEKAGLSSPVAEQVARDLECKPELNLDFHARVELGIDPSEMGSPKLAAGLSFLSFGLGALVPLLPWVLDPPEPLLITIGLSALALFTVGAGLARYTEKSWVLSGLRQLGVGIFAAAVTMAIGSLFGTGPA